MKILGFFQYKDNVYGKLLGYYEQHEVSAEFIPAQPLEYLKELLDGLEQVIDTTGKVYKLEDFINFVGANITEGYKDVFVKKDIITDDSNNFNIPIVAFDCNPSECF